MGWSRKDLLGLRQLSAEEIKLVLDTAVPMKEIIGRKIKKTPTLRGRSMATLFYENSTRTRTSFELAAKFLSADTVGLSASSSSVMKGESLRDTGLTLDAMGVDVVVIRHPASGAAEFLAGCIPAAVINAGDGTHEHPTQALLDMFTIREKKGTLAGLKVAIVGDILHSRVARSNIWGLTKMGAEVRVTGPATLMPPDIEQMGARVYTDTDAALEGVDVVNVLRIQLERQQQGLFPSLREYSKLFGINQRRLELTAPDAIVIHPGPINRGVEIDAQVAYGSRSLITRQVTNGVAVRMAILYLLTGGETNAIPH
ncbi:Aspartate carbamoyltransferase [Desulfotomaculum nigrificans CO-1-SRB]|uniref:Aspartate carbamoyltransferase n=1 Tax=Desulfotomaculum nigrificans (strain DSM 14880 / VKM B-2319 / CO-1-SRB) TaxID=868595 RepID=F6B465_DESCC|nr:aspartate carbamoyltransferase catalytic subunit [Desulfotomaculum nigrificans]AEF94120.1 Aspartate carbamoyltransferase [Desulfotomaculum nigrificans CO-1-SRB]